MPQRCDADIQSMVFGEKGRTPRDTRFILQGHYFQSVTEDACLEQYILDLRDLKDEGSKNEER